MANNIGTHLAVKLEEISNLHSVMDSMSILGTCIKDYDGFEAFVNVFVHLEGVHNKLFEDLSIYLLKQVVPIVGHINDRV
jgi:hypothetical protein